MSKPESRELCIDRCGRHNFYAISIMGKDSGTRLTSGKCCGSWDTVKSWTLDAPKLRALIADLQSELNKMETT